MTPAATVLTSELLDRFRRALRFAGAPLGDELTAGLSDTEIDGLGATLGVHVPPELRTLWRWGVPPTEPLTRASMEVNGRFELWPPDQVIKATQWQRAEDDPIQTAIAFAGLYEGRGWLLVDGRAADATSQVIHTFNEEPGSIVVAPSLGALFAHWTKLLEDGDYHFDGQFWEPEDGPLEYIETDA